MRQYFPTLKVILVVLMFILPGYVMAQDDEKLDDTQNAPGFDPNVTDEAVPFDGGLSLLIAAGIGYGAKKKYDERKKKAAETNGDVAEK